MTFPYIQHHGAVTGVTGSCHQLHADAANSYLIDCGLFQGSETNNKGSADQNSLAIDFSLGTVRALIATHVHIDHVGRIPYLLAAGFKGPILCSEPSARLLPIVLEDAFKLGVSRDQKKVERYIKLVEQRLIALPYNIWFALHESKDMVCRVRLQRAGHILGSAYVEFDISYPKVRTKKRVVFSGDLGAPHAPLLYAPSPPDSADILVIESTYGDRNHDDRHTRRQRLERVIEQALEDNGSILIPAFSIGRTQELLYELESIIHDKRLGALSTEASSDAQSSGETGVDWPRLPIILDSPLANRFTAAYRELKPFWNQEAIKRVQSGRRPLGFERLLTVDSHAEHVRMVGYLARSARPAIVIAGNGMCSSGRIVNYLKAMLGDQRHNILFVGYQAAGTPGQAIQRFGPKGGYVDLDGERLAIRAGVTTIGGYSAHADQEGLVKFVTSMRRWPSHIRIVHGESKAKQALAARLAAIYQDKQQPLQLEIPQ
jgi:metallo-beta-lactamase family protein